jgi:hypothetical protein
MPTSSPCQYEPAASAQKMMSMTVDTISEPVRDHLSAWQIGINY